MLSVRSPQPLTRRDVRRSCELPSGLSLRVEARPRLVKAFLKGMIKANRFFMERRNKEAIIQIVVDAGFVHEVHDEERLFHTMFENSYTRIPPDCHLPLEAVEQSIREQIEQGQIDESVTLERVVKIKALEEAQREVGLVTAGQALGLPVNRC